MTGERKGRIDSWLRINLEVFTDTKIEREPRANLNGICKIEADERHVEGKFRIARTLKECIVPAEGKIRETAEIVSAAEGSILPGRVRVKSSKCKICQVCVTELHPELHG